MLFLSKLIEKVIASRIISHIENNAIIDKFQSAYKCGHSTETALLRVYGDIVSTIGKGNGSTLVLLDLSAAFDTHSCLLNHVFQIVHSVRVLSLSCQTLFTLCAVYLKVIY